MSSLTLGRDDLMRLAFEEDFFDANPALAELREEVRTCRAAYQSDAASSRCRCGGDPRLILGCLGALLTRLESLRTEDHAALAQFFAYVGAKRNKNVSSVTIYYRGTSQTPLRKIRLP
jgi:hypothetical protein